MAAQTIEPSVDFGPIESARRKLRVLSTLLVSADLAVAIERDDLGGLAEIIDDVNDQLGVALEQRIRR